MRTKSRAIHLISSMSRSPRLHRLRNSVMCGVKLNTLRRFNPPLHSANTRFCRSIAIPGIVRSSPARTNGRLRLLSKLIARFSPTRNGDIATVAAAAQTASMVARDSSSYLPIPSIVRWRHSGLTNQQRSPRLSRKSRPTGRPSLRSAEVAVRQRIRYPAGQTRPHRKRPKGQSARSRGRADADER